MNIRLLKCVALLFAGAMLMCGCRTTRYVPVEGKTTIREVHSVQIDTLWLTPPAQTAERSTYDSISHLETDFAESNARINPDGSLLHTLANKTLPQPVASAVPRDTIFVEKESSKPYPVEKVVKVEKPLSWWQNALMWVGGICLGMSILAIIYCVGKYRKS